MQVDFDDGIVFSIQFVDQTGGRWGLINTREKCRAALDEFEELKRKGGEGVLSVDGVRDAADRAEARFVIDVDRIIMAFMNRY